KHDLPERDGTPRTASLSVVETDAVPHPRDPATAAILGVPFHS
ncbi:MAG: hypothetical protein ACI9VS_001792, partial [Candidatus Binatia bacterium]